MNASLSFGQTKCHLLWTLIALLILVHTSSKSQTPDWVNHPEPLPVFGGDSRGNAIARDALGNLYVAGYFEYTADFDPGAGTANLTSAGVSDIFLAKYDASGQYLWAIRMGSTNNDIPYDLALDGSGNVCLTGGFQGTVDFDPGAGTVHLTALGEDIFFAKYDASGNYLWAKRVGGNGSDFGSGLSIDGNGHICLTGAFENTADFDPGAGTANLTSAGSQDIFIAKYDASGNYLWAKRIGDAGFDRGIAIALDGSGNVHVTGDFENTADFDPGAGTANLTSTGAGDIFIAKYTSAGNYLWAKKIGGTVSDQGTDLAVSNTGHVDVTGLFRGANVDFDPGAGTNLLTSLGSSDIFITQYDASGNYQWAKRIGGIESDAAERIAVDGNYIYLTGYFFGTSDFDPGPGSVNLSSAGVGDLFVAHYTASGDYVWAKRIGGTGGDGGLGLVLDGSSNLYLTGLFSTANVDFDPGPGTAELSANGGNDPFILSLSATGTYNWAINWGEYGLQPGSMACSAIARDASGNVYATGYFNGTKIDFDPGVGVANMTSIGGGDIFIAKYDAAGNYLWCKRVGGTDQDWAYGLALDATGNVYLTGIFGSTVDFDPGAGSANLTSAGQLDVFLAKYDPFGNYLWVRSIGGPNSDLGYDLAVDGTGNVHITGVFEGINIDFDPGGGTANLSSNGQDIFIAQYDALGNYQWAKRMGGTDDETSKSIYLDESGNHYITGYFGGTADFDPGAGVANLTSAGQLDIFFAKYDAVGNYLWAKRIGGPDNDQSLSVNLDGSGNVLISGGFKSTNVDFDPNGGTANLTCMGDFDLFIAKYNNTGSYIWAKSIGGASFETCHGLTVDGFDNVYITGNFLSTNVDFDPGAGVANLTNAGESDIFLAKYDATGQYLWAKSLGSTDSDASFCIAVGGAGKINIGGGFLQTVDFDPGPGTVNRTAVGQFSNIFIAQYAAPNPVVNGQAPVLSCPGDIVQNNDPGQCSAVVHYNTPASDDPQDNVAIVPPGLPSGSAFPVGTTAVTWEATDGDGLTARCTFTVTVTDAQAPSIGCPPNKTSGNDPGTCSATVSYPTPTASDNCPLPNGQPTWVSGGTQPVVNGPNSTSLFPKGINTVIWKVTDAGGNTQTCSFRVIVNDVEAPQINCPANMTVHTAPNTCASAPVAYGPVTATDNCMPPNPTVLRIGGLPSGANFPTGVNIVTWRATDAGGRTATCSFKVTVADAQPPVLTCPDNIVVNPPPGQCGVAVFYNNPMGSDNCGIQNVFLENGLASGSTFPAGTSSIVWRATDLSGTTKTCSFTITVNCANARPSATSRDQGSLEANPAEDDFLLIPNPAAVGTTDVQVRVSGFSPAHPDMHCFRLNIFDTQGRLIYTQNLAPDTRSLSLDVSSWVAGMYFVSLHRGAGHTRTKSLLLTN